MEFLSDKCKYFFMIENIQGGGGENVNVSYKATGKNNESFAHSTNAFGIQFAEDENENIPFCVGITCMNGMLMCLENVSCTSL